MAAIDLTRSLAVVELPFGFFQLEFGGGRLLNVTPSTERHENLPNHSHPCITWFKHYANKNFTPVPLEVLALSSCSVFQQKVLLELTKCPAQSTVSYMQLGKDLGYTQAAQAVGQALHRNPLAIIVPCHRVIQQSGNLGGFAWGLELKSKILAHEGLFFPS